MSLDPMLHIEPYIAVQEMQSELPAGLRAKEEPLQANWLY